MFKRERNRYFLFQEQHLCIPLLLLQVAKLLNIKSMNLKHMVVDLLKNTREQFIFMFQQFIFLIDIANRYDHNFHQSRLRHLNIIDNIMNMFRVDLTKISPLC